MAKHKKPRTFYSVALKLINRSIRILLGVQGSLIMKEARKNGKNR